MALNPALELREAIVTLLKADAPLVSLVTTAKIFGEFPGAQPVRPFVRYGEDDVTPQRVSCWAGANVAFPVHAFSAEKFTDQVKAINAAIVNALDGKVIVLDGGVKATITWNSSQLLRDGADPNAWHGFNQFEARC
jgi:hypothetical protein